MSREKEHIDQQIREKLLLSEVAPPASVWVGIEKAMAAKRKAAIVLLYRKIGYAAALLLFGFLAYYFTSTDRELKPTENKISKQTTSDSLKTEKDSININESEVLAMEENEEKESNKQKEQNTKSQIQKDVVSPSIAKREDTFINDNKQTVNTVLSFSEESVTMGVSDMSLESIAYRKPAKPEELTSIYKSNYNPLSLFKAYAYKQMFESEEMSNLLADNTSKDNKKNWSIGLAYSPTTVGRFSGFSTKDAGLVYADAGNEMLKGPSVVSEKDLPAYAGGINLALEISERWSFKSGVYYLKQGQRIDNFSVLANDLNASNNSSSYFGNISIDNTEALDGLGLLADFTQISDNISYSRFDADLVQQFELLEIPFIASYKLINRKLVFSLAAGINQGFLIGNRVYLSDNSSETIGKTDAVNKLIYKSVFGISFEYPLSRKLYFNFSPTLKNQLTNFNKNAIKRERLQYFELKTGLNYRF